MQDYREIANENQDKQQELRGYHCISYYILLFSTKLGLFGGKVDHEVSICFHQQQRKNTHLRKLEPCRELGRH